MYRNLILFFVLTLPLSATAQQSTSTYYIDVLIDADRNIYFEDSKVGMEEVPQTTRSMVNNLKFDEGRSITYRIFAAGDLPLGVIMDVNNKMLQGFTQPGLATKKYLLQTAEVPKDKSNWVEQLNKLDLKAIEN